MPLSLAELEPLLLLARVQGVGAQRMEALVSRFGDAEAVLSASRRELETIPGVGRTLASRLVAAAEPAARAEARAGLRRLQRLVAVALTPEHAEYPQAFRALPDAPYLLFALGDLTLLGRPAIAVVGTRTPSAYGRDAGATLTAALARVGYAVVSGMAKGIDAVAHDAALRAEGGSIGVLGHGIDLVYPDENRALFRRMRERGLLLTEYPPGEKPHAGNFPRRNRLITALSDAVLVIEMGLKSGAQHTVTYALEQGKDVMAVPGPIGAPTSAGTNQLLKEGARLVTSISDVLEELQGFGSLPEGIDPSRAEAPALVAAAHEELTPDEQRLVSSFASAEAHVDEICTGSGLPVGTALSLLLTLELKGMVAALPGKRFRVVG